MKEGHCFGYWIFDYNVDVVWTQKILAYLNITVAS